MRSSRLVQTILQALILVMLAAIVFRGAQRKAAPGGGPAGAAPGAPSKATITREFRAYFQDHETASQKAELLAVEVRDVSVENTLAYVKLRIDLKWLQHNPDFQDGPLRGARGNLGDSIRYVQVFKFRRWDSGWHIEGHLEPPEKR